MSRGRAYLRVLPESFTRKAFGVRDPQGALLRDPYPPAAVAAFYGILCLAESQPDRGRFTSLRVVRALLEGPNGEGRAYGLQVAYLVKQRDLVVLPGGAVYVDGWDELQEGDFDVNSRMRRYRDRKAVTQPAPDQAQVMVGTVTTEMTATVTERRGHRNDPSTAIESTPSVLLSGERRAENYERLTGSPSREPTAPTQPVHSNGDDLGDVQEWLARERSASIPDGGGLRELARLVDQHGAPAVIQALAAQDRTMKDGRQYVFGAMKALNPLPDIPRKPLETPEQRELREMAERIDARQRAKETR